MSDEHLHTFDLAQGQAILWFGAHGAHGDRVAMPKPSFDHLCLEIGTKDITKWSSYMYPRAEALSGVLYKTRETWGHCPFCELDYPLGMSSHITGKNHLKRLQQLLNFKEPRTPAELEEYTQVWDLQFGYGSAEPYYYFNHLTGDHGFCDQGIGSASGATVSSMVSASEPKETRLASASVSRHAIAGATADAPSVPASLGVRPNFDHLCLEGKEYARWASYIQPRADCLLDILYRTRSSWGRCLVCEAEYPASLASHIAGKGHIKRLQFKLNYREPRSPAEVQEFTQVWDLEYGYGSQQPQYFFNHITGENGFGAGPASARPTDDAGVGSSSSSSHLIPVAMPSRQLQGRTSGQPATADHSNSIGPQVKPASNSEHVMDYQKGLESKAMWHRFIDQAAKQLEDTLFKATGDWVFQCAACQKSMDHGAHDHMVSKAHFWALWSNFDRGLPNPDRVVGFQGQPWVSRFGTPRGDYLFNLLTGEQGFESELSGTSNRSV